MLRPYSGGVVREKKLPCSGREGVPLPCTRPCTGIDEAGRGCLAGPVVAAAVHFPEPFDIAARLPGLTDSKKLAPDRRKELAGLVAEQAAAYGLGFAWQDEIDSVNILNATFRAMSRAVLALAAKLPGTAARGVLVPPLLIDGSQTIPRAQWEYCTNGMFAGIPAGEEHPALPSGSIPTTLLLSGPLLCQIPPFPEQHAIVGGDTLVPAISAASVLAKTMRDRLMEHLDKVYPGYGLAQHKGYGTKKHLAALAVKGPCRLHRKTFRGVRPEERQFGLL